MAFLLNLCLEADFPSEERQLWEGSQRCLVEKDQEAGVFSEIEQSCLAPETFASILNRKITENGSGDNINRTMIGFKERPEVEECSQNRCNRGIFAMLWAQ